MLARVTAARRRIGACSRRPAERLQRGASLAGRRSRGRVRSISCASVGLEAAGRSTAVFGSRAASKLLVCGGSRLRTGLPRLERLHEKTESRQRAGGTCALPKPSSSASCLGRPARAAALSFAGVPETTQFRRRRAPLVTRLGAALVWGTRGQRMEAASSFIGRVNVFLRTKELSLGFEACLASNGLTADGRCK